MFLKMAILSLSRHKKRTVLIILAIAISVFALEIMGAMFDGMRVNFFKSLTKNTGHIVVYAKGYKEQINPLGLEKRIDNWKEIAEELKENSFVVSAEGFLKLGALAVSVPIDWEKESRDLAVEVVGTDRNTSFYSQVREGLIGGAFLPYKKSILISQRLAELLDVKLGDILSLIVEGAIGEAYYLDFSVDGIFKTSSDTFDEGTVFIQLSTAQELAGTGDSVTEIRLLCQDKSYADMVKTSFFKTHPDIQLDMQTWKEINGGFAVIMDMVDVVLIFMNLVVLIVGGSLIANAILMNVFDRIREYGTLRAIGLTRKKLLGLIVMEGSVEGVIGTALGLFISLPLIWFFSVNPISGIEELSDYLMSSSFTFVITAQNLILNIASGILLAIFASLYAGFVASKKTIYQSLTYI
ncbi:FtsX-like permease family protein [Spirochaetia bacterium 38H-sp]|uniref:FtsX-like permease family protein n=1 Tax=Rarispira pelagica TaxID=3141764 RepID=A0ABU9U954_9SPIR